jgi:hypothetical protein
MLDDRRRDHVALGIRQGLLFPATLNDSANRTSLRNSSAKVGLHAISQ